jgi:hypothetical protein
MLGNGSHHNLLLKLKLLLKLTLSYRVGKDSAPKYRGRVV